MPEIVQKLNKEKWYQSRRIWGSILSTCVVVLMVWKPEYYDVIAASASTVALILGLNSWTMPKK